MTNIREIITPAQFSSIFGSTDAYEGFVKTAERYQINSKLRIAHFLGQSGHESGGLKVFTENLNYSKEGLLKTFSRYFNSTTAGTYARKQVAIASRVYANRLGNGDEKSGDGWRYRGRGAIQITGKANYAELSKDTGIDFVSNPDLLSQPEYALLSAGWYWNKNNINAKADKNDIFSVSKAINLPSAKTPSQINGYADREARTKKILSILG